MNACEYARTLFQRTMCTYHADYQIFATGSNGPNHTRPSQVDRAAASPNPGPRIKPRPLRQPKALRIEWIEIFPNGQRGRGGS